MQFNVTLFSLLICKRIYIRRLHRNAKDQGIRGSVLVPVSTFTFLFEEIDVETYIIPKRILNDTRIIAQTAVYKGAIIFLDALGSEVKSYISIKLLCGGELWHGCQGSRLYTDLQTALPLFPHQTRHEIYMARLSTNTGPLIGKREMFIL